METKVFNLHFTDFCNFCCKHCFVKKDGKELSFDAIKIIGDKLRDYQRNHNVPVRVNLAGGEPLLSQNIQRIIDYFYSLGLEVSIITNGYLLTEAFILQNKNKLSTIGISVDSLNRDTNIKIGRCYKGNTISNEHLIDICRIIKSCGIALKINTCVTTINVNEDINELLDTIKPDRVKVLRAFCDKSTLTYCITDEEWESAKKRYPNAFHEDNDYMSKHYWIIDSSGNLTKDNLHITNNSLINNDIDTCLENLLRLEGQQCQ